MSVSVKVDFKKNRIIVNKPLFSVKNIYTLSREKGKITRLEKKNEEVEGKLISKIYFKRYAKSESEKWFNLAHEAEITPKEASKLIKETEIKKVDRIL
ncbi:MAG: hypothetical protein ACFFB5_20435 [Promethearchaeota archaeon]